MPDVANLEVRVGSRGIERVDRQLDRLSTSGARAERSTSGLMATLGRFAGPAAAAAAAMAGLSKTVSVTREFDQLNAGLITATGSAEDAAIAFEALERFAAQTPFDLQQSVRGFTQLVNLGLTPSERALRSFGDTASAMGRSLNQMVEAVADAATGEFERLKEFGIRASAEGDRVAFTFRGVTTEVGKNAAEIEDYLISLGEVNFAGAMLERMNTLDGALSNLGDSWDGLFREISSSGIGDAIETAVRQATAAIDTLTGMIGSGEIEGYLKLIMTAFEGWDLNLRNLLGPLGNFVVDTFSSWGVEGEDVVNIIMAVFRELPADIRASVDLMAVGFKAGLDRMKADAEWWKDAIKAVFTDETIAGATEEYYARQKEIEIARTADMAAVLQTRNETLEAFDKQLEDIRERRRKREEAAGRDETGGDALARFGVGAAPGDQEDAAADKAAKKRQEQFQDLVESLRTEEEAIRASYEERRRIIEQNTAPGSGQRSDLMGRLDAEYQQQLAALQEAKGREIEEIRRSLLTEEEAVRESYERRLQIIRDNTQAGSNAREELTARLQTEYETQLAQFEDAQRRQRDLLYQGLLTEEESIAQSYERRRQQILESTAITEQDRLDLLGRLETQHTQQIAESERERHRMLLGATSQLFEDLSGIAFSYAGKQSDAFKALFAVSKAFSIAQTLMSIQTGIARSQELAYPANLAEMARISALGATLVSDISSLTFSGAYDKGGRIPSGSFGVVGERGPELIRGPAEVTSRADTAKMLQGGASVTVNVINQGGQQLETTGQQARTGTDGNVTVDVMVKGSLQRLDGRGELDGLFRRHGGSRQGQF